MHLPLHAVPHIQSIQNPPPLSLAQVTEKQDLDIVTIAQTDASLDGLLTVMAAHPNEANDAAFDMAIPIMTQHDANCIKKFGKVGGDREGLQGQRADEVWNPVGHLGLGGLILQPGLTRQLWIFT